MECILGSWVAARARRRPAQAEEAPHGEEVSSIDAHPPIPFGPDRGAQSSPAGREEAGQVGDAADWEWPVSGRPGRPGPLHSPPFASWAL
jgi:hypothetical protein